MSAGWRRTLPAVLAPLLSDEPIALATVVMNTPNQNIAFSQWIGGHVARQRLPAHGILTAVR